MVLIALAVASVAAPAWSSLQAQESAVLPDVDAVIVPDAPARCNGEIIREIIVYSAAPTVARSHRLPVIGAIMRSTHVTTRPEIVRGFLQFEEGDACTELARAESERVLRAQPFIADADVAVVPTEGGVRVEVRTTDETSLVLGTRVRSGTPYVTSMRLGNSNLGGTGVYVRGEWRDGGPFRDGGALTFTDHQFLGEPYELDLHAQRAPLGGEWQANLTRPFYTGLQRHAWRLGGGELVAHVPLRHPDSVPHLVRVEREYADAGFMGRIGPPVRLGLLGLQLSHEQERVGGTLYTYDDDGTATAAGPYAAAAPYRSTRLNAFVGFRSLAFARVEGFDGLMATQDIPVGVQAGVVVGQGLETPANGSRREVFLAADIYAGRGDATDATRVQLRAQGARSSVDGRWGRVIATGRFAHQVKPTPFNTLSLSAEWAASWRPGAPLQLMLGARDGGVRGYGDALLGGSGRAVVRVEDRVVIPEVRGAGDLGLALFADAGRVWSGDAPFAVTSPIRPSVGFSILGAVPTRSARVWRLDVALPLHGGSLRRIEVGLTRGDRSATFWREPADVAAMRGPTVPSSVFAWP